ncbi:hypothetical protein I4U23_000950 [Adineta vaga]|nr:hypothetical protein I4U23_000950 [Adineta vaga]
MLIELPELSFKAARPLYSIQHHNIWSIRQYFEQKDMLLFPTFATINAYYLCYKREFHDKISPYFHHKTKTSKFLEDSSKINRNNLQYIFQNVMNKIKSELYDLRSHYCTRITDSL